MSVIYDPYDPYPYNTHRRRTAPYQHSSYHRPYDEPVKMTVSLAIRRTGLRFTEGDWDGIRGSEMYLRFRRNQLSVQLMVNRDGQIDPYVEAAVTGRVIKWAEENATDFFYVERDQRDGETTVIYFLAEADAVAFKLQFHGETEIEVPRHY